MFNSVWNTISYDMAIDLGTANTLVYVKGRGIVIREPSIITRHKKTKQLLAYGRNAKKMLGRTPPSIQSVRLLRSGVIADFDATKELLQSFIHKVHERTNSYYLPKIPRPRIIIGIPSGITEVERKAVQEAALKAGARTVWLIEEQIAAAIGAGLSIDEPSGNCIVDIGGGTTEMAILSLGGVVVSNSLRIAGDEFDKQIASYIKDKHSLLIGESMGEEIKLIIGCLNDDSPKKEYTIRGRDVLSGLPKTAVINSHEIAIALRKSTDEIIQAISDMIQLSPPELVSDILQNGIFLSGGGALLDGLADRIEFKLKIPVHVADDPLTCVVRGCAKVLESEKLLTQHIHQKMR